MTIDVVRLIDLANLEKKQRSIYFPLEIAEKLDDIAARHGVSVSHVVATLVLVGLDEYALDYDADEK